MNPNTFFGGPYNKPFKIFVTATENHDKSEPGTSGTFNHQIAIPDAKAAYEEVLSSTPESQQPSKPKKLPPKPKLTSAKLQKFNKCLFLKSCQENDLECLSGMDLTKTDDLNVMDAFGWNGLMIAACSNAVDAFSHLLAKGINYELTDRSGSSALALAEKKGHSLILEAFRGYVYEQRRGRGKRREENSSDETKIPVNSFHCPLCDMTFSETTPEAHSTSVLHQFNSSHSLESSNRLNYGISVRNPGYQLMLKQGWGTRGLGPDESGRLYPVKTMIRKSRTGLGMKQDDSERVTHFQPNDPQAIRYRPPERTKGRREMSMDYESNRRKERRLRKALS